MTIVEEHTQAYFVAQGRQIASSRIVLDEQSLFNQAFQFRQVATSGQKATLVGFTLPLLSIAVDEARKLATMADVATVLGELAATGDAILANKKAAVHSRAALHGLTAGYLDQLRAAANEVSAATATHVGRRRSVSQGSLDLEDGIDLHVLGSIIDAFDAAHDVDPTIPRLDPISTRHLLGTHHAGRTASAAGPTTPGAGPTTS